MFKIIAGIAIILFLFTVVFNTNEPVQMVFRIAIFGVSVVGFYWTLKLKKILWLILYGLAVILYNPVIPFQFHKHSWAGFGLIGTIIFAIALVMYLRIKDVQKPTEAPHHYKDEKRPDREAKLWEKLRSREELEEIRTYIIGELCKIELTDWGQYALKAIFARSSEFTKLLIGDELDIDFLKVSERNGITDAIESFKDTDLSGVQALRQYFQRAFANIYKTTSYSAGNKFYWFGRDRVISMLRSYQASKKEFVPARIEFCDVNGEELVLDKRIDVEAIKRIKATILHPEPKVDEHATLAQLKEQYRFKIDTQNPMIEFDLDAIKKAGNFKYEGSLVNSVYIDLRSMLNLCKACDYEGIWANSDPVCDAEASYFAFGDGYVMVAKYRGAVEYFPDRLYIEFKDIDPDSWIIRWLKSYKLHLEGND